MKHDSLLLLLLLATISSEAFIAPSISGGKHRSAVHLSSETDINDQEHELPTSHQSRKRFFTSALSTATLSLLSTVPQPPQPANALYGDSPNVALPNYIEFLIEKNASLDQSKVLYKGADAEVQIRRISDAAARLKEIPAIAKDKKWSQVQGILLGPLGTVIQTMNTLTKDTNSAEAKKAMGKFKGDIILIGQEATQKSEGGVLKACEEAQKDLETFAKLVF